MAAKMVMEYCSIKKALQVETSRNHLNLFYTGGNRGSSMPSPPRCLPVTLPLPAPPLAPSFPPPRASSSERLPSFVVWSAAVMAPSASVALTTSCCSSSRSTLCSG